jgi:hypothetical protein
MSLAFLNPLFLFGLAAGILPILIHRLTEKKAIPKKFSAVRLLLQSQKVVARPQRLKHLLLLALRILAVMTLVLMMARPVLTRQSLLTPVDSGNKILILDNSLSMGYREERGERYDLAKRAAKEILEGLKGQVMLIPTAPLPGRPAGKNENRWMSPQEALSVLPAIPLSFGRGDPAAALAAAYRGLKDIKASKEVLIISDMARGDWEGFSLSKLGVVSSEAGVTFLRIGGPNQDSDFAVKGVALAEGEAVTGVPARLEVAVANFSDKSGSPLIQLYLSGVKVDQKSMELKAGQEGKVFFELFLERPGWANGEVRLSGDQMPLDDVFYFPLKIREKVRVLIVDGDPKTSLKASESYYVVNALNPGGSEGSPFLTKVITEEELASLGPALYDALFLLNVSRPQASRTASFLEAGKPVFIFLGDRVIPEEYNSIPLFPWRLGEVKEAGGSKPARIAQANYERESLRPFSGLKGEGLKGASFRRYLKIEGSTRNLLTLGNNDPLLVQANLGKGTIFLFASSADLDWNDFPLKAAYLPLIQGLLKEAVGLTRDSLPAGIRFGEPFEEKSSPTQVTGPQGGPGIYQFFPQSGELRRAVNPPLEESDLGKVSDGEIRKMFGMINTRVVEYREGTRSTVPAGGKELWPFLLAFLLVVLAAEMGVASRI